MFGLAATRLPNAPIAHHRPEFPTGFVTGAHEDLQAPARRPVRVSTRCHRARLDTPRATGAGADAPRVDAAAARPGCAGRRLTVSRIGVQATDLGSLSHKVTA